MNRIYLILLAAALALPAQAYDWPWQSNQETRYGFCKGFVMAGLAEEQLGENSRIDLWLTWNYINRAELPEGSISKADFQQGRDQLTTLVANGNFQGIREITDSECYLGRNRHAPDEA